MISFHSWWTRLNMFYPDVGMKSMDLLFDQSLAGGCEVAIDGDQVNFFDGVIKKTEIAGSAGPEGVDGLEEGLFGSAGVLHPGLDVLARDGASRAIWTGLLLSPRGDAGEAATLGICRVGGSCRQVFLAAVRTGGLGQHQRPEIL